MKQLVSPVSVFVLLAVGLLAITNNKVECGERSSVPFYPSDDLGIAPVGRRVVGSRYLVSDVEIDQDESPNICHHLDANTDDCTECCRYFKRPVGLSYATSIICLCDKTKELA